MHTAVYDEHGHLIARRVRIAHSFVERLLGLLPHSSLSNDEGLLLTPGGSIHTWGMRFAIDVVFLDEQGEIVGAEANILPWRSLWAPRKTTHTLELACGRIEHCGITPGQRLHIREIHG